MMMLRLIALLLLVGVASARAQAAEGKQLKGTLYDLNSRQKRLYTWEMRICGDVWTSTYRNLDGTTAVEDRVVFESEKLVEYSYVRHRIGERSSVSVHGKNVTFKYSRNGASRTATSTTRGIFLTGPAVFPFLVEHLGELQAGKVLELDYGVLDRLDYYRFTLSSQSPPGSASVQVEIAASSFFVRMAIDPIIVTLSRDGNFRGIRGRSILMELDQGRLRPVDADLVVESETTISCNL